MRARVSQLLSRLSLLNRIFLATSIALLVAAVLMLQISSRQDVNSAREDLKRQLADDLAILPGTLDEPILMGDYTTINQILSRYVQRENLLLIRFLPTAGKEMTIHHAMGVDTAPEWFVRWMGMQNLTDRTSIKIGGRDYGTLEIQVSVQKWTNQSWGRFKSDVIVMLIAVLLDFIGIWIVLKSGLRSLDALQKGSAKLAEGDLNTRLVPRGSPELRRSMESFNAMADAMGDAQYQLRIEAARLQKSETELKELNASLEARVTGRTRDLEAANFKLMETVQTLSYAQNQLVQTEKMAALGGLVAGISHEINTPLGIGVTSASSIEEQVKQLKIDFESGSMKRTSLESFINHVTQASSILLKNLHRASELIKSFKKIAVDQSSDESRMINLYEYVDEVLMSLHPKLQHTAVTVKNNCTPDLSLYTQPGAIYQIISNLLLNSLAHAYEVDQIGIITISAQGIVNDIVLEYHDDGKGIEPEFISRVFDPFFTTKRGNGGSGLGLNIVYNLVHRTLNGSIEVISRSGQGTRFKITFPKHGDGGQA